MKKLQGVRLVHITTVPKAMRYFVPQMKFVGERGVQVHLVTSPGESLTDVTEASGTSTHVVPMSRAITPVRDAVALWRMYRVLRRVHPHVVHAHTPKAGYLGMLSAWIARVPARIYHIRGLRFETTQGLKRKLLVWCEKLACSLANEVLCVSHSVREVAIDTGIVSANKIKVLLNGSHGLDAETRFNPRTVGSESRAETRNRYNIPDDALVIGFVGRLVRDKGIAELAEAWQKLAGKFPSLYLLAVGPFESEDPVPRHVRELFESHPRIRAIGSNWETPPLFAAMDVVCLPTYREGLPRVPLEAAAMELPVVATAIPGCVDAVRNGVNGLLVPPKDPVALQEALERYLESAELRRLHGRAGRQWVLESFSPELMCEAVFQEYSSLLTKTMRTSAGENGYAHDAPPAQAA